MRPEVILRVARKELTLFFASPIGAFLVKLELIVGWSFDQPIPM